MKIRIDELDLKHKKKFEECLDKEKLITFLESENEILKTEIVTLTNSQSELTEKVRTLQVVNENNFKKITELQTTNEHLSQKI